MSFCVREAHSQLAGRQVRFVQSQFDHLIPDVVRNAVRDAARMRTAVFQSRLAKSMISVVPAVEGGLRGAQLRQRLLHRQVGLLDQSNDLQLLECGPLIAASSDCRVTDISFLVSPTYYPASECEALCREGPIMLF